MNQNIITLEQLKVFCRFSKLRPKINIESTLYTYTGDHDKKGKQFFSIHFYWDEYYLDSICDSPKLKTLQEWVTNFLMDDEPKAADLEWGTSDGHLFCYITCL